MIFKPGRKILIILAHPDDEVLGAGGLIIKARSMGASVRIVWLGEGISARFKKSEFNSKSYNEASLLRQNGAKKAMKVLGIDSYDFGKLHCLRFDQTPIIDITKKIENEIRKFEPDILITHNPSEVNIDHVITFKAVEAATRPNANTKNIIVLGCEIPCSGRWVFENKFQPNIYIDIKDFFEKKLLAWSKYTGEARQFPFPRSNDGLATLAKYRGMEAGVEMAEAFKIWRLLL